MDELVIKLNSIPNSYFGFVAGVTSYAKKKHERLKKILDFINNSKSVTASDIVYFIMSQPDFHEEGLSFKEMVG